MIYFDKFRERTILLSIDKRDGLFRLIFFHFKLKSSLNVIRIVNLNEPIIVYIVDIQNTTQIVQVGSKLTSTYFCITKQIFISRTQNRKIRSKA